MHVPKIEARFVRMKDAEVTLEKYSDGSLALVARDVDEDGMPNIEAFSTNLSAYNIPLPENNVFIKDYSEHEGLAVELEKLGLVKILAWVTFGEFSSRAAMVEVTLS